MSLPSGTAGGPGTSSGSPTRRSPTTPRPSGSIQGMIGATTTAASPGSTRRSTIKRSPTTPRPSGVIPRTLKPSTASAGSGPPARTQNTTLRGDHHLLDHPSHRREGGDGFTAETAETAEEHAEETTTSESGSSPPDPPDPLSWLCPHLRGLCGLRGEPRVSITTVAAVRPVGPRWGSPRRVVFSRGFVALRVRVRPQRWERMEIGSERE